MQSEGVTSRDLPRRSRLPSVWPADLQLPSRNEALRQLHRTDGAGKGEMALLFRLFPYELPGQTPDSLARYVGET